MSYYRFIFLFYFYFKEFMYSNFEEIYFFKNLIKLKLIILIY